MASEREDTEEERRSKSQRKREMLDLQDLGEELSALGADELQSLSLPENLLAAIPEYQRTPTRGGRRRQMQHIGKLMRGLEGNSAREAVEALRLRRAAEAQALHDAERWRARLLESDEALTDWMREHPAGDLRKLRHLVRNVRTATTEPLSRRAPRELFRFLRSEQ